MQSKSRTNNQDSTPMRTNEDKDAPKSTPKLLFKQVQEGKAKNTIATAKPSPMPKGKLIKSTNSNSVDALTSIPKDYNMFQSKYHE